MSRLLGVDVFAKKLEMDEERFVPEGLGYKTDLFEEEEKVSRLWWLQDILILCVHGFVWKYFCSLTLFSNISQKPMDYSAEGFVPNHKTI